MALPNPPVVPPLDEAQLEPPITQPPELIPHPPNETSDLEHIRGRLADNYVRSMSPRHRPTLFAPGPNGYGVPGVRLPFQFARGFLSLTEHNFRLISRCHRSITKTKIASPPDPPSIYYYYNNLYNSLRFAFSFASRDSDCNIVQLNERTKRTKLTPMLRTTQYQLYVNSKKNTTE